MTPSHAAKTSVTRRPLIGEVGQQPAQIGRNRDVRSSGNSRTGQFGYGAQLAATSMTLATEQVKATWNAALWSTLSSTTAVS